MPESTLLRGLTLFVEDLEQNGGSCRRPTLVCSLHTAAAVHSTLLQCRSSDSTSCGRACVRVLIVLKYFIIENNIHVTNAFGFYTLQASFPTLLRHLHKVPSQPHIPFKLGFLITHLSPIRAAYLCMYAGPSIHWNMGSLPGPTP